MKHLLKGFLVISLSFGICAAQALAQDSVKRAKHVPINAVKTPVLNKPAHHYIKPAVPPAAGTKDTAQANAMKAQMDPAQLNDKSLNGQYQYLLSKTYHFQQPLIAALWKNAMDTLNQNRRQLKDAQAKLASQGKSVDSLKASMTSKDQSLNESNAKVDSISVFGAPMSKSTYNVVMFCLVGGLAAALAIVIITTAKHKHEAKHRTELYEEIEEEYKNFKAKAHEKELKLSRELQTERNKLDELLGRG